MSWAFFSPNCFIDRTFNLVVYFPKKEKVKKEKPLKTYRNPIFVAMEYKNAIANGQVSSESALARKLGISRVRVNQMIKLLKLDNRIVRKIIELGDPLSRRIVTERMLRPFVLFSYDKQKQILSRIADLSS